MSNVVNKTDDVLKTQLAARLRRLQERTRAAVGEHKKRTAAANKLDDDAYTLQTQVSRLKKQLDEALDLIKDLTRDFRENPLVPNQLVTEMSAIDRSVLQQRCDAASRALLTAERQSSAARQKADDALKNLEEEEDGIVEKRGQVLIALFQKLLDRLDGSVTAPLALYVPDQEFDDRLFQWAIDDFFEWCTVTETEFKVNCTVEFSGYKFRHGEIIEREADVDGDIDPSFQGEKVTDLLWAGDWAASAVSWVDNNPELCEKDHIEDSDSNCIGTTYTFPVACAILRPYFWRPLYAQGFTDDELCSLSITDP